MSTQGIWTALATPMKKSASPIFPDLDKDGFDHLLAHQKAAGVAGVIACGTTGESPTLTLDEKKYLIRRCLEFFRGSGIQVFAGTGTNNTRESIEFSKWASDQGVHGVLIVTPYYNKPSQAGLELHYRQIADAVDCEVMIYNVPGRTSVSIAPKTIAKLAQHPRIRSLKEATGSQEFIRDIKQALENEKAQIQILSGDDLTFYSMVSLGVVGNVSVASNLIPKELVELNRLAQAGNTEEALKIQKKCEEIFAALFCESNPVPVKYALSRALGFCGPVLRAPLVELQPESKVRVNEALKNFGFSLYD